MGLPRLWLTSSQRLAQDLIGVGDLAGFLVEVVGLAFTIGLDAQVDGRDRRVAQLGGAKGLGVARAAAFEEVLPESVGVLMRLLGLESIAAFASIGSRRGRPALELLLNDSETLVGVSVEHDRRGVAADHFGKLHVVAHRGGDQDLAAFVVVGHDGRHVRNVAAVVLEVKAAGTRRRAWGIERPWP